jgi:hypothetical protein
MNNVLKTILGSAFHKRKAIKRPVLEKHPSIEAPWPPVNEVYEQRKIRDKEVRSFMRFVEGEGWLPESVELIHRIMQDPIQEQYVLNHLRLGRGEESFETTCASVELLLKNEIDELGYLRIKDEIQNKGLQHFRVNIKSLMSGL